MARPATAIKLNKLRGSVGCISDIVTRLGGGKPETAIKFNKLRGSVGCISNIVI